MYTRSTSQRPPITRPVRTRKRPASKLSNADVDKENAPPPRPPIKKAFLGNRSEQQNENTKQVEKCDVIIQETRNRRQKTALLQKTTSKVQDELIRAVHDGDVEDKKAKRTLQERPNTQDQKGQQLHQGNSNSQQVSKTRPEVERRSLQCAAEQVEVINTLQVPAEQQPEASKPPEQDIELQPFVEEVSEDLPREAESSLDLSCEETDAVEEALASAEREETAHQEEDVSESDEPTWQEIIADDSVLKNWKDYFEHWICNMRISEATFMPSNDYIGRGKLQVDITPQMRGMLVDWLVEVAEEYGLRPETLYLSINLVDRSLSKFPVPRTKLQLLGCAAMLLASKYEEVHCPAVDEFVYISDDTYSREQILSMEKEIVRQIDFRLTTVTPIKWLSRFFRMVHSTTKETQLACYLAELCLVEYEFLQFLPSHVAGSCLLLARIALERPNPWPQCLQELTDLSGESLMEPTILALDAQTNASTNKLTAIYEKYGREEQGSVSRLPPPSAKKVAEYFATVWPKTFSK